MQAVLEQPEQGQPDRGLPSRLLWLGESLEAPVHGEEQQQPTSLLAALPASQPALWPYVWLQFWPPWQRRPPVGLHFCHHADDAVLLGALQGMEKESVQKTVAEAAACSHAES
ncbi:hypothetical protein [Prochlorococcus marinus]|uniref:hypothetical protein n=1 Tax=Prochlorococcus marinus TaxID=1219 RepID=UPI0007BAF9C4|nr:hypothetical protein [Prochlorococcus marinus]KZR74534.1 hypothetical protein PMIT1323_02498 [Prochlorococcus marinus str. MIT 1323]